MSSRPFPIRVRIARPDDREALLAFATTTWGGWDYIPGVLDEWMVPGSGVVLVATVEEPLNGDEPLDAEGTPLTVGQPIAMVRVVMLSATEAWLEGIRVDPRVRGMDVATDLQVAELHWIAAQGARVVRYMTGHANVASQRLGARHGLLEIGRWRTYGPAAYERGQEPPRTPEEIADTIGRLGHGAAGAWDRVRADPMMAAGLGLYEYRPWSYQELTEERFARHAARGEVLTSTKGDQWVALIVNRDLIADGRLHVAFAAGDGEALLDLLVWLGRPVIRLPDPNPPILAGLAERFASESYQPADWSEVVVERHIDAAHPVPDAAEPALLVFGDQPRRICVPPRLDP